MRIGTYAIEQDYSHYIAYISKTIFAVVGTASKGPIGEAVVCTSAQDLVNKFGKVSPKHLGLYAAQYFLSQSSKLYFVRAAHSDNQGDTTAKAASVSIIGKNAGGNTVTDALTFSAKEMGTYANGYRVLISEGTAIKSEDNNAVQTYTITVSSATGLVLEKLMNKTMTELLDTENPVNMKYVEITGRNSTTASLTITSQTPVYYELSGGLNGDEGVDTTSMEAADYISAAKALLSDSVDMNLFAVPGVSDPAVIVDMLAIAEQKGDCLYLVDPPSGLDRDGVVQWHNGVGDSYNHAAFNSSYGALYYDWVKIYDSINKQEVLVPPSVAVAAAYAYSDRVADVWYAPAGLSRGLLRGVLDTDTKLSKADVEYLYSDSNNINSIYDDPQSGLVIWGQKTLYREDTALNRVNVRRLMNYLKRVITAACNYLTFEPNDRVTWNSFEMKVLPTLESIKAKRGIYEYRVVKGETIVTDADIDNYRMPCMIMIRPTKAAEEIPIYFAITSTGADFNEVLDSNGIITE